ncbi:UNVERIFIED_ORG: hypothetical protein J3D58_003059 [Paenarthrobacter nicotinovorans]
MARFSIEAKDAAISGGLTDYNELNLQRLGIGWRSGSVYPECIPFCAATCHLAARTSVPGTNIVTELDAYLVEDSDTRHLGRMHFLAKNFQILVSFRPILKVS